MKLLKKAFFASFVVQIILLSVVVSSAWLGAEQSAWLLLFPFVAGVPVGPLLLRPLIGIASPDVLMNVAMLAMVDEKITDDHRQHRHIDKHVGRRYADQRSQE